MPKGTNKEVQRVQEDIQEIVDGLEPAVQQRWFGYKPNSSHSGKAVYSPLASPAKAARPSKSKPKSHKKLKSDENRAIEDEVESDSSVEFVSKTATKKRKQSLPDDDDGDADKSVEMSCYVYVETPPPASLNIRKNPAKPLPVQSTELGPFKFNSSTDFSQFLSMIATACQSTVNNLPIPSLKWKFDRPKNAEKKGLTNKTAYDVMITSLMDRNKDYVFSVYMSPPTFVKKELPWLKDENDTPPPDFEYNVNNAASSSVKSIRDQIASIDAASSDELQELLERYPIDNNPLFPGKHIFHNETGYFDLTDMKLRVWAVAKAKGNATIDKPPASTHFFKNQTIKSPRASGLVADVLPPHIPSHPHWNQPPYHLPYQLPFPYPPPYGQPPHPYGYLPPPGSNVFAPNPQQLPSAAPPPVVLPREIPLEEYCNRYKLVEEDRRVLTELGYMPGDEGINDLDVASWQGTRVLPLAKSRILRQHQSFLKDVANRLWDA